MFVLDTDHLTIAQQQATPAYEYLIQRVSHHAPSAFLVSIISFHEQVMGWNAYLSRATTTAAVVRGYERLGRVLANFSTAQVLPFDDAAANVFDDFRTRRVRTGVMDLRIAAIAFSRKMTVLTRNVSDFRRVPGLKVADWTLP
jgi:tRNA(fMet)-specific endonuclease VapC